jgi:hypothetical protein
MGYAKDALTWAENIFGRRTQQVTETRLGFKLAVRVVDYIGWVLHP